MAADGTPERSRTQACANDRNDAEHRTRKQQKSGPRGRFSQRSLLDLAGYFAAMRTFVSRNSLVNIVAGSKALSMPISDCTSA